MAEPFQLGEEGSRKKLVSQLQELRTQGEGVLEALEESRLASLVEFDRRLSSMNSRRQRSHRIASSQIAARFLVSDLLDIDQTQSTGTIRADSESVTLRERSQPTEAQVRKTSFSADRGTVETLDAASTIFRVHVIDGTIPVGQFDLELIQPLVLNLLVFDIVSSPSEPAITVQASSDGVTYQEARSVSRNGYRVNSWLPAMEVRFIRIVITPSHPDDLGGTTFSFGITGFSGITTQFHLRSELISHVLTFTPNTQNLIFRAVLDPDVTYFLSLAGGPFIETSPDKIIPVSGAAAVSAADVVIDSTGLLAHSIPSNYYPGTLKITESRLVDGVVTDGLMTIAPGLLASDARVPKLVNEYIGVNGSRQLYLIRNDYAIDIGRIFNISYITGPASVTAQLKVRLSTEDRAVTPVFHGAALEEV
jgi:hypothetical protein